ncbi:hypothetical protein Poli38472_008299 [Pythium oligandrum]|uniref:Uncharacterized protein n=1 Tax=Pythium oligandrum TaxID=41045 RepID=A0A8K1FNA0_PYTOL|nr:hypothetical protein Poli38472_008299 [Pythium oligandrum]|eukprot:TMW65657.1 hypothetical protein Poli38472_008299 [Pythium oligandrum]
MGRGGGGNVPVGGTVDISQWKAYFTEAFSRDHEAAHKSKPTEDACRNDQAGFIQCLNSNTNSVTNCQPMIDALQECRKNQPGSKSKKTLAFETPSGKATEQLNAYQVGLLEFFECVNDNARDIMNCQERMDALRQSQKQR